LKEVKRINDEQRTYFVNKMKEHLWVLKGKKIAVLGLSFKPDTDDMRFAPSLDIVDSLLKEGAMLFLYDPCSLEGAKKIFATRGKRNKNLKFCKNPYEAAAGADCLCVLTEWKEFEELDFAKIKNSMHYPLIADGRNMFDKEKLTKIGIKYIGIGK
jgi:UDPglucose 6-dehydrogenase